MTNDEMLDRLDGIYAFDSGCVSSGIKDDAFKVYLKHKPSLLEALLTDLARQYLNDHRYTIEDIARLLQWAERELGASYT